MNEFIITVKEEITKERYATKEERNLELKSGAINSKNC